MNRLNDDNSWCYHNRRHYIKESLQIKAHELEKARRSLQTELDEVRMQVEELEDNLKLSEDARLRLEVNMQAMKIDFEKNLQIKEMELDGKKKSYLKQIKDLEVELDNERRSKLSFTNSRKKLEAQVQDLDEQLDLATRLKEDYIRQLKKANAMSCCKFLLSIAVLFVCKHIKKLLEDNTKEVFYSNPTTGQIKDLQRDSEEVKQSRDDLLSSLHELEKRLQITENAAQSAQDQLDITNTLRHQLESERDDLHNQLSSKWYAFSFSEEEKRRLEDRIRRLTEELEEELSNVELAHDKMRKAQAQVFTIFHCKLSEVRKRAVNLKHILQHTPFAEQLTSELAVERGISQKFEAERSVLERQNKELRTKIAELESSVKTRSKAQIAALEVKVSSLEEQLSSETADRQNSTRAVRKFEKRLNELQLQVSDEQRQMDAAKVETSFESGTLERACQRGRHLKQELDDAEEEKNALNAKVRKFQREMEDLAEANETLSKENQNLRTKLRRGADMTNSKVSGRSSAMNSLSSLAYNLNGRNGVGDKDYSSRADSIDALNCTDGSGSMSSSAIDETNRCIAVDIDRKSVDNSSGFAHIQASLPPVTVKLNLKYLNIVKSGINCHPAFPAPEEV
uniref:Myosin tail domain-containing protein n=1 Tax=Romanomermis culicivorax TaxID=13658 RepID=A0A915I508_ROMCU